MCSNRWWHCHHLLISIHIISQAVHRETHQLCEGFSRSEVNLYITRFEDFFHHYWPEIPIALTILICTRLSFFFFPCCFSVLMSGGHGSRPNGIICFHRRIRPISCAYFISMLFLQAMLFFLANTSHVMLFCTLSISIIHRLQ